MSDPVELETPLTELETSAGGADTPDATLNADAPPAELTRRWIQLAVIAAAVLGVDQYAKYLTVSNLRIGQSWEVLPGISQTFRIMHSTNTGAAFGMFPGGSNIFLVVALITTGAFLYMVPRLPASAKLTLIGLPMVVGGALSNALDRIRFDHVTDYFFVRLTPDFANISNFADHAITIGVGLILIEMIQMEIAEKRAAEQAAKDDAEAVVDEIEPDAAEESRSHDLDESLDNEPQGE